MKVKNIVILLVIMLLSPSAFGGKDWIAKKPHQVCKRSDDIRLLKTQLVEALEKIPLNKWTIHTKEMIRFSKQYTQWKCSNRCQIIHREMLIGITHTGDIIVNSKRIHLPLELGNKLIDLYKKRVCMSKHPKEDIIRDTLKFLNAR